MEDKHEKLQHIYIQNRLKMLYVHLFAQNIVFIVVLYHLFLQKLKSIPKFKFLSI